MDGRNLQRPQAHLHPKEKGILVYLRSIWLPKLDLLKSRWIIGAHTGLSLVVDRAWVDYRFRAASERIALLVPPGLTSSEQQVNGLIIAVEGRFRDFSCLLLHIDHVSRALIVGHTVISARILLFDRDWHEELQPQSELREAEWWLLDGLPQLRNFSETSADIELQPPSRLTAQCESIENTRRHASICLNEVISNNNGHFSWVGRGKRGISPNLRGT